MAKNRRRFVPQDPVFLAAYSDASVQKKTGAGWAMWGRDRSHRVLSAGPAATWARGNSNLAELCGVVGAALVSLAGLDADGAHILVVKTDSLTACGWFGRRDDQGGIPRLPRDPRILETMRLALLRCAEAQVKLVVTWVKGHQAKTTTRGYLNDRVDAMAKEARKHRTWTAWMVKVNSDERPRRKENPDDSLPFARAVEKHLSRWVQRVKAVK